MNTARQRHRWLPVAGGLGLLLVVACVAVVWGAGWLAPLARQRLVGTLGAQLGSPIRLGAVTTRYDGGLVIDARDLAAQTVLPGVPGDAAQPMLRVRHLSLRVGLLAAAFGATDVSVGELQGVEVVLPPVMSTATPAAPHTGTLHLSRLTLEDAHLTFLIADAARAPFRFDLPRMVLTGRPDGTIQFAGSVDAGSPVGVVDTTGSLGPWQAADPRTTPLTGSVAFHDRSMAGVRGLRGMLSLQAAYRGTLGRVEAQGTSDDPAFALDVSAHPTALHTRFSLTIDAVHGVVQVQGVDAHFLHTRLLLAGTAIKNPSPEGYALDLALQLPDGRIEDALLLGAHTQPTLLRGGLTLRGRLGMAAGGATLADRLSLAGTTFRLTDATFGNADVQRDADSMSERAAGQPKDANPRDAAPASATAAGNVALANGTVHLSGVRLTAPGAQLALAGNYTLGGGAFHMAGSMHTEAKASELHTGWKSWLTRPFNGLMAHGRTGATFPLQITGAGNTPRFRVSLPGGEKVTADH